ncbi:hypothetical protein, partial [Salmonella enterica]|uniref:hypothetical protein n=1 Tax=Salmonella enterica TaxID=28901 RepID=UPI001F1FBA8D
MLVFVILESGIVVFDWMFFFVFVVLVVGVLWLLLVFFFALKVCKSLTYLYMAAGWFFVVVVGSWGSGDFSVLFS